MSAAPSSRAIEGALRTTTERLARELHSPSPRAPEWSEFEWHIARAAAAMQGISGLLAATLRWSGPEDWNNFLARQRTQSQLRHARAVRMSAQLDAELRAHGAAAVALKGAALVTLGLYEPGVRPMGDLDILVRPDATEAATRAIQNLGYAASLQLRRHRVFAPPAPRDARINCGEHVDNPLKIELHVRIAEQLPVREVEITDSLFPITPSPGLNPYRDLPALLKHLLLHAAGNMRANALRQIQLHDIALLAARIAPEDWPVPAAHARRGDATWWMFPPLALTDRYLPGRIPGHVLAGLRARCPRRLRAAAERATLTDVSWSNARVAALPGLAWAGTPAEMFRYARNRLLPDRVVRAELEAGVAAQPALRALRWYDATQFERVLRWMVTRPPRVQTMVSVRAALRAEL